MSGTDRRTLLKLATVSAVAASSLSLSGRQVSAQEAMTIRYGWWGGTARQQSYTAALEKFEAANPNIKIEKEFADYEGFQERMTTQMAAGDVPDIFWVASPQVLTYERAGLFRQLDDIATLDLSDLDEGILETIRLNGVLNTMPNGIFTPVVRYNETFAEEDGVELPSQEDGQWTWEKFAEFLIDYNENNASGRRGITYDATADLPFEGWCRQHGEELWSQDGSIGWTMETLVAWFEWWENLRQAGAALSVSEQEGVSKDWQLSGDKVLATFQNSNHIVDDAKAFPDYTFRMREIPVMDGAAEEHKFLYYPRMAIYSGIDEAQVEAAGSIVNYIINDVEFVQTTGLTMGAPINPRIRAEAQEFATDAEIEMLNIVEAEAAAPSKPRYEAPAGSNNWRTVMTRTAEEIALEQSSIEDACQRMMDEIAQEIERAR
jgi:ABC-type glycerol-3-phosphate transport system substrate-binding protein